MLSLNTIWPWFIATLGLFGWQPAESSTAGQIIQHIEQVLIQRIEQVLEIDSKSTRLPKKRQYSGKVNAVSDGDTLRLRDSDGKNHKVRLAYIDAPETTQQHGIASRDALREALIGETVQVNVFDVDQYGREVARVNLNGKDINLQQVQNGNAWHYVSIAKKKQDKSAYREYEQAQKNAKDERVGLWQQSSPTPPWTYRKQQREQQ
ncbi:MAG: thermonuclease family protein [Neisseria sp.]|nr:thermonuclease family protein [Neisseria sp.]